MQTVCTEQQATNTLLQISESQGCQDYWTAISKDPIRPHVQSTNPSFRNNQRKHIDTQVHYSHRDALSTMKYCQQLKTNNLLCYETLKTLDECRPIFSHRQAYSGKFPIKPLSKKCSSNPANLLVLPSVDQHSQTKRYGAKLLEEPRMSRRQLQLKENITNEHYKKYSKYSNDTAKHQLWGDYFIHLPSVITESKATKSFR